MTSLVRWALGLDSVPKLFYPATVAKVAVRKSVKPADVAELSLKDLVETRCPSLHDVWRPAWWLPK